MKKIISFVMAMLVLTAVSVTSFAENNAYDVYAYGNFETYGNNTFYARLTIKPIEKVEKLELIISYNEENLDYGKSQFPDYITVSENHTDGRIVLTLLSEGNFFEDEKINLSFISEKEYLTQEEIGFEVTANAVFTDGSSRNLVVKTNVEIYIHLPELIPSQPEMHIRTDKNLLVAGETVSYTIPVVPVKNAEKIAVKFTWDKDILSFKECYFTENFVMEKCRETDDGFEVIFRPEANDEGTIVLRLDILREGKPNLNISVRGTDSDGNESDIRFDADMLVNYVYTAEQIGKIVLSGRIDIYRTDDILYLPFTVTEKFFENGLFSTAEGSRADLAYRLASSGYTDRIVVTGENIVAYVNGIVMDKITICIAGDINKNGTVTAADARLALRAAATLEEYEGIQKLAADTDKDGEITASDARKILRCSAGVDSFAQPVKDVELGEEFIIDKLKNAGSGAYNWKCTVSDESAFEVSDTIAPPENVEINPGTPYEQTFVFRPLEVGVYNIHFELVCSWDSEPIDEFELTIHVNAGSCMI